MFSFNKIFTIFLIISLNRSFGLTFSKTFSVLPKAFNDHKKLLFQNCLSLIISDTQDTALLSVLNYGFDLFSEVFCILFKIKHLV